MGKQDYTVTLDKEAVEEAKKKFKSSGQKLSPILTLLLKAWNKYPNEIQKLFKKLSNGKEKEKEDDLNSEINNELNSEIDI